MIEHLDNPTLLSQLLDWARRVTQGTSSLSDDFLTLADELQRRRADGIGGVGDEAVMLATALRKAAPERCHPTSSPRPWSMVAGALTPMVQMALARAIERRSEVLRDPPETPYRRSAR